MALDPKITGGGAGDAGGVAPPPGAPIQITTPGSEVATAGQIALARANEQELPAFAPKPMTDEAIYALLGKTKEEIESGLTTPAVAPMLVDPQGVPIASTAGVSLRHEIVTVLHSNDGISSAPPPASTSSLKPPDVARAKRLRRPGVQTQSVEAIDLPVADATTPVVEPIALERGPDEELPPVVGVPPAPAPAPPTPYQPAASDTDSPSRGMPSFTADVNKRITGGFGDIGEAQYFPMDGREVRVLTEALMDQIYARIQDDLRFQISAVYPRVNVRVVVEVECFANDQSFAVSAVAVPHNKTPMAIAREYGDQVVFAIVAERVESTRDGQSVTPPNQTRLELGLAVPRKQAVQTPGGRQIVDTVVG